MSSIKRLSMTTPIGIARVKVDPDLELNGIFQNKYVLITIVLMLVLLMSSFFSLQSPIAILHMTL